MALTPVRAKLGDEWVTLTYNSATGRYEGQLDPPGTSIHQPGGYYNVEVEALSGSGETAAASGEQLPSLRLVVRETAAPVLTLISPQPGYLATGAPAFVFEAVDEEGGSGVDPESFQVLGSTAGVSAQAIPGGFRFAWSPPGGWSDGAHTVSASVRDFDGNQSTVSGAYVVDTVPPALLIREPYMRHVTDAETAAVSGDAWDATSPSVAVIVAGMAVPVADGRFSADVPLAVGENHILATAVDGAGNQTVQEIYMIRLITDRTQADVDALKELYQRPVGGWTQEELERFDQAARRGSYDAEALNRVGVAAAWLAGELRRRGYIADIQPKTDWTEADGPTMPQMLAYLQNVEAVRTAQGVYIPEIPGGPRWLTTEGANAVEKALVEADALFPLYAPWTAGEITCGGV